MSDRIIKIGSYGDVESLKMFILQKLNLVDYKTDYVKEFYERLRNYIDRNKNLKITFQFDRGKLEKDLKFKLSLTRSQQSYPDNFEMGNPHNRWLYDPIVRTEKEARTEEMEFEKSYQDNLSTLNEFIHRLEQLGNGQIFIKDS
jgi:hypothetical protein